MLEIEVDNVCFGNSYDVDQMDGACGEDGRWDPTSTTTRRRLVGMYSRR